VVANRYLPDFYGAEASSFLHQTGTDRLWVSWWLTSDHVKRTIGGDQAPEASAPDDVSIEIPGDINSLQQQEPRTALKWREETRAAFTEAIREGYVVVGFVREKNIGRYVLRRGDLIIL
jgi:predicted GNAT superfamily acetyltransferase